jgi:predicted  nucleic acid-binding Zn-ribbon protein
MLSFLPKTAAVLSIFMATALCLHPAPVVAQGKTQKISKNLVKRAEDMVKEVEKTKKQADKVVSKYDSIFSKSKVKDRQKEYKNLNNEIKKTEDRVKDVRKRAENMQKEADKFFSEWSKGLTKIKDQELRGLSHENMIETRDRYGQVIESGLRAGGLYDSFLTDLKNQISYLELDMSDTAMEKLKPSRSETKSKAKSMFQSVDQLIKTTKGYIASMK